MRQTTARTPEPQTIKRLLHCCILTLVLAAAITSSRSVAYQGGVEGEAGPAHGADADASAKSRVERLVLALHPHGVGYDEARALGPDAVPHLIAILDDPQHKMYWVTALVTLGFLEDPGVVDYLIGFYESSARPTDVYTLRAHLAVPFALGSIAASPKGDEAYDFLRSRLEAEGRRPPGESLQGVELVQARFERIVLGLALSGRISAKNALSDLRNSSWFAQLDSARRSQSLDVFDQADAIAQRLANEGRSVYFSYRPEVTLGAPAIRPVLKGLPPPHLIAARRHAEASYSNADLEADLSAGTQRLQMLDTNCEPDERDVACPVSFQRSADVSAFGSANDGLNDVTTNSELQLVFSVPGARIKVVSSLSFCNDQYNETVIGCATISGSTMVLESGWAGSSLFLHEFGHNRGLGHRDSCVYNVMSSSLSFNDRVVNTIECNKLGGGGVSVTLNLDFAGDGSGSIRVEPMGVVCSSDCSVEVPYATSAQLEPTADADSVAATCRSGCSFNMVEERTETFRFLRRRTLGTLVLMMNTLMSSEPRIFESGFEEVNR